MKKLLLSSILILSMSIHAQDILTEDGASLLPGNIGSDLTGTIPGQGNWLTRISASGTGTNADFQIVDYDLGTTYGNVIQITGHSGATATVGSPSNSRFMSKGIASAWLNRDFGNDIAEVEYNFFTGAATTSSNTMRVVLYDSSPTVVTPTPKMLAGFMITMNPLSIRALAWYDPTTEGGTGAVGNYSIPLGTNGAVPPTFSQITLLPQTWYKLGFSYNSGTGELKFKDAGGLITRTSIQGAAVGTNVDNVQIIGSTGGTDALPNTASSVGLFDNLIIRASATDTLLGIEPIEINDASFEVYPNPANNFISVSSRLSETITSIAITDMNGRIVKSQTYDNLADVAMNISDLANGMYLMNIASKEGNSTQKIIKN
jgi:hypothetical protein